MEQPRTASSARRTMIAAILALVVASVAYRLLVLTELQHTSLVFIGVPALLAIVLLAVQPKTAAGSVHKTIALALCLSGIVFGEGFVCILMASPLFFLVGALVARLGKQERPLGGTDLEKDGGADWKRLGIIMLVPMSLEGVIPHFELARDEVVVVSKEVSATSEEIRFQLAQPLRFDRALPLFLTLGFPTPATTTGQGLEAGNQRSVQFIHGGHHPGTLVLEVTHSDPSRAVFTAIADDSYISHWLSWRDAEVSWKEVAAGRTLVTWTLRYRRRLDPAWYFKPLERYGVSLAAKYLIETLATPAPASGGATLPSHPASH